MGRKTRLPEHLFDDPWPRIKAKLGAVDQRSLAAHRPHVTMDPRRPDVWPGEWHGIVVAYLPTKKTQGFEAARLQPRHMGFKIEEHKSYRALVSYGAWHPVSGWSWTRFALVSKAGSGQVIVFGTYRENTRLMAYADMLNDPGKYHAKGVAFAIDPENDITYGR